MEGRGKKDGKEEFPRMLGLNIEQRDKTETECKDLPHSGEKKGESWQTHIDKGREQGRGAPFIDNIENRKNRKKGAGSNKKLGIIGNI